MSDRLDMTLGVQQQAPFGTLLARAGCWPPHVSARQGWTLCVSSLSSTPTGRSNLKFKFSPRCADMLWHILDPVQNSQRRINQRMPWPSPCALCRSHVQHQACAPHIIIIWHRLQGLGHDSDAKCKCTGDRKRSKGRVANVAPAAACNESSLKIVYACSDQFRDARIGSSINSCLLNQACKPRTAVVFVALLMLPTRPA